MVIYVSLVKSEPRRQTIKISVVFFSVSWPWTGFCQANFCFLHWCSNFGRKIQQKTEKKNHEQMNKWTNERMKWLKETKKKEILVAFWMCMWMRFTCVALAQWCFYLFPGNLMSEPQVHNLCIQNHSRMWVQALVLSLHGLAKWGANWHRIRSEMLKLVCRKPKSIQSRLKLNGHSKRRPISFFNTHSA